MCGEIVPGIISGFAGVPQDGGRHDRPSRTPIAAPFARGHRPRTVLAYAVFSTRMLACRTVKPMTASPSYRTITSSSVISLSVAWLGFFIIYVQRVGLGVVRQPNGMLRRPVDGWNQLQIFLNVCYGHSCLRFSRDRTRRVRNAVMIKPSSVSSRYTTTRCFPTSNSRTAISSPPPALFVHAACRACGCRPQL